MLLASRKGRINDIRDSFKKDPADNTEIEKINPQRKSYLYQRHGLSDAKSSFVRYFTLPYNHN